MEIPDYIQEEINKYLEEKRNNKTRFTTYDNINAYINLARTVGRITEGEAEMIKKIIEKK